MSDEIQDDAVTCSSVRGGQQCFIPPALTKTWGLNDTQDVHELVGLALNKSGRLTMIIHIVLSDDEDAVRKRYVHYSELLAERFGTPSHKAFKDYGRLGAWATRALLGQSRPKHTGYNRIVASEGWSSGDIESDLVLYAAPAGPKSSLFIVHSLPKAGND
jgi:hypothetical protein